MALRNLLTLAGMGFGLKEAIARGTRGTRSRANGDNGI